MVPRARVVQGSRGESGSTWKPSEIPTLSKSSFPGDEGEGEGMEPSGEGWGRSQVWILPLLVAAAKYLEFVFRAVTGAPALMVCVLFHVFVS